jgi:hypothetical protein
LSRRAGTAYWLGVAAVDGGGNRGPAAIIGPVTPAFDATAAILPVDTVGSARLGDAVATGRFNDDAFDDVAIGAPYATAGSAARAGAVYVYFGSAAGIDSVPDVVITGLAVDGAFGSAVTAVRWSSATRDDLVIGEPYTDNVNGRIYVFEGGPTFVSGSVDSGAADVLIRVDGDANHFTGGGLGYRLASLDFDGDGFEDLAMASVIAGAGNGAVAIRPRCVGYGRCGRAPDRRPCDHDLRYFRSTALRRRADNGKQRHNRRPRRGLRGPLAQRAAGAGLDVSTDDAGGA